MTAVSVCSVDQRADLNIRGQEGIEKSGATQMRAMLAAGQRLRAKSFCKTEWNSCTHVVTKHGPESRRCHVHAAPTGPAGATAAASRKTGLEIAPWVESPQNNQVLEPPDTESICMISVICKHVLRTM